MQALADKNCIVSVCALCVCQFYILYIHTCITARYKYNVCVPIHNFFERRRRSDADKFAKIIQILGEVHLFLILERKKKGQN